MAWLVEAFACVIFHCDLCFVLGEEPVKQLALGRWQSADGAALVEIEGDAAAHILAGELRLALLSGDLGWDGVAAFVAR
ncbi:hypothetical protein ACWGLE_20540 [Streptomyces sp. NPDC055897]